MRILYHHRTRAEDAQGIHIEALCSAFRALGHEVELVGPVTRAGGGQGAASAQRAANTLFGVAVPAWFYELLAIGYNLPALAVLVLRMLRRRPDLLYERYALFNVAGLLAARLFRVPFVLEINAPLSEEMQAHGTLVFRRAARAIEDWLCRRATRTVVVTAAMAEIFAQRGAHRERLMVIPNGVDRRHFNTGVDGGPVRRRLGLEGRFVVGFVGWIRPWHGVDRLLDALARLVPEFPRLHLMLVGDGPALPDLRAQAQRLSLEDAVTFVGSVAREQVPCYIAAADVAVQPDVTSYASPIKLFEYLAMGRPVVAPRRPNIEEVITEGRDGLLFTPGDVDELAGCLRRLLKEEQLRRDLALEAERLVEQRGYYWEANAQRVLAAVGLAR